jgi:anti-sigma factor (TIGR02949 family)
MNCETWQTKLDAYADAELPPETMRSVAEHLSGCPACTAEMAQILQLKRVTASAGKRYTAPPELRARVRQQIAGKPARGGWRWALGLALAAVVVIGLGLAIILPSRTAARNQLIAGVVDRHVTALASASPVDVVSSDRHTVKPWFAGKLPFTFNPPDLTGSGYTLVGGRMVFVDGEPGAHLICDWRQHRISILVFQDQGDFGRLLPSADRPWRSRAFNVETWSRAGLRYFIVSDAGPEDVNTLAELWKKANS